MGLNKFEKYLIYTVIVLIVLAIGVNYNTISNTISQIFQKPPEINYDEGFVFKMTSLPLDIKQISDKYNAFKEIYHSDELILTYGYEPFSLDETSNKHFHKKLNNALKEQNINIKVLSYPDWKKYINKAQEENGKDPSACTLFSASEKDLQTIIETTQDCFRNTCLIDAKHNKYVSMNKNIADIVATIKQETK